MITYIVVICVCVYIHTSCMCTVQAFVSALQCELEREGLPLPVIDKNVLGIKGTERYTMSTQQHSVGTHSSVNSTTPEARESVVMLYKQWPVLRSHHMMFLSNYTEYFMSTQDLRGVVVVLQVGTWYNTRERMQESVQLLLDAALDIATTHATRGKHVTLVWAEQVAQHWPTSNGYFATTKGIPLSTYCPPLSNDTTLHNDWRNDLVWELLQSEEWRQRLDALAPLVRLHVLNFRALTKDLSSLHMRQQKKDCTHYCYTPLLYQPIYHQLAQIGKELAASILSS